VLLAAVTVNVDETALVPVIDTVGGLNAQVGGGVPPLTLTQDRVMLPVYPLLGLRVIVEVAVPPGPIETGVKAEPVSEYVGGGATTMGVLPPPQAVEIRVAARASASGVRTRSEADRIMGVAVLSIRESQLYGLTQRREFRLGQ
jgi:hypothetical protein